MRVSLKWLSEYVDLRLPPEELAARLTMAGLAVDAIVRTGGDWGDDIRVAQRDGGRAASERRPPAPRVGRCWRRRDAPRRLRRAEPRCRAEDRVCDRRRAGARRAQRQAIRAEARGHPRRRVGRHGAERVRTGVVRRSRRHPRTTGGRRGRHAAVGAAGRYDLRAVSDAEPRRLAFGAGHRARDRGADGRDGARTVDRVRAGRTADQGAVHGRYQGAGPMPAVHRDGDHGHQARPFA